MGNLLTVSNLKGQSSNQTAYCNIYTNFRRNKNTSFLGIDGYEGIPENFVINLMGWLVLNLLFIVLRKKAWNYGRMAVMQKEELKWTDILYGDDVSLDSGSSGATPHVPHGRNQTPIAAIVAVDDSPRDPDNHGEAELGELPTEEVGSATDKAANNNNNSELMSLPNSTSGPGLSSAQKLANMSEIKDSGYFSWIKVTFTLTDQQYQDKCGSDCVSYLSFQRHLIVLATIITCCSLLIILPINMFSILQKTKESNFTSAFSDTTIINLDTKHEFLWPHVVLAITFLFLSIGIMRHYSKGLQFIEEDSTKVSLTICIIGVNKGMCREDILRSHLLQTYSGTEILEVSFAYDISKLQWLEFQRLSASSAKMYFQQVLELEKEKHGGNAKHPKLRPYICGVMGWCCGSKHCGKIQCKKTDAIEYYTKQEGKYTMNVENERQRSLTCPLGIAFVTFSTIEAAERIVEDYACSARLFLHTPESKYTKVLNSNHWIVKFAPVPQDIYWENLTLDFKMWYVKFFAVNLLLAIMVVIFSTPVFVFTMVVGPKPLNEFENSTEKQMPVFASAIVDTLPTLVVVILGQVLIGLVYQSDVIIGFWTKTAGNLSEMIKIFFFLTFMVIVLPALGVTSISYFLNQENSLSWSCIFYKENGALFVNYICTSSLCGTAAELMRLSELFVYAVKLCFARSVAEVGAIRKSVLWDFQIGSNYAWMMLHFAIFTCFSVIYPLVTPFGLLYLVLKHLVDRYNIYFAYAPCKVEREVHATAVNFVIMSMFMLQVNLLAYVHFHIGGKNAVTKPTSSDDTLRYLQVFSLLGFSVTAALFLGQLCFNVCADFSPIHHFKIGGTEHDEVLEVGRASALPVQPQTHHVKRRTLPSRNSGRGNKSRKNSKKRNSRNRNEGAPLSPLAVATSFPTLQSNIQVGVGGELRLIPLTTVAAAAPADVTGLRLSHTPSVITVGTEHVSGGGISSVIVSSNYSGSGKPYGRYISPLLRPEFIRLVQIRQHQQDHSQAAEINVSEMSEKVEMISEKHTGKK